MVRPCALVTVVVFGGCVGEEKVPLEPAPLAEVCGSEGAVRLLALGPDEWVVSQRAFGERIVVVVGEEVRVDNGFRQLPETTTVHAFGPCGEDAAVVGRNLDNLKEEPRWPGVALGCTLEGRDLVRLDLSGASDPVVLADDGCGASVTEYGLLTWADAGVKDGASYWTADFFPLLDEQAPVFGEAIRVAKPVPVVNSITGTVSLGSDEVLMVEDGELARYAIPELTRSVLERDVVTFAGSDDERYLLYQLGPSSGDDPYNPIGPIYIRDRRTGTSMPIGSGALTLGYPYFFGSDFAAVMLGTTNQRQLLVSLPEFEFIEVPEGQDLQLRLADGRWLSMPQDDYNGPWYVVDLEAGEATLVADGRGRRMGITETSLDLLLNSGGKPRQIGPWMRYFFDGRAPQTLAERATASAVLREDGRIVTLVDVDEQYRGEMTLVDPSTGVALRLDGRVSTTIDPKSWQHPVVKDAVVYGVVDGERSGVWVARPAAAD